MIGEIDYDFYCSADLYNGNNKLEFRDPYTSTSGKGICVGVCTDCHCFHRKWSTPEQFKEKYGRDYPDDWAVYVIPKLNLKGSDWTVLSYKQAKAMTYPCMSIICMCSPWGKPDKDWRP